MKREQKQGDPINVILEDTLKHFVDNSLDLFVIDHFSCCNSESQSEVMLGMCHSRRKHATDDR